MAGLISVSGLTSTDTRVTAFVAELYSDSGLTTLVDVGTEPSVCSAPGTVSMAGAIVFDNLTVGTTYYLRSCTIIPAVGRSDWSSTYSLAAGDDGSITFGSGPASGTATDGAIYFDTSTYVMYVWYSSAWHMVGGGGSGSGGIFSSGSNANGNWVQDPTGHIHQWGTVSTDINGGTVAVTFPMAFASATGVVVNLSTKSITDRITYVVDGSVTAGGFTVGNNGSSGFAYWEADGPGVPGTNLVLTNPMTTEGDLIASADGSGTPARIAAGIAGYVLTSNGPGALPTYQAPSGGGGSTGGLTVPPLTGWIWDEQGSSTLDVSTGSYAQMNAAQYPTSYRMVYRTPPSTPYKIAAAFACIPGADNALDFGFRDNGAAGSGKYLTLHLSTNGNLYVFKEITTYPSPGAYTSISYPFPVAPALMWFRIGDDGTNLTFEYGSQMFSGGAVVWITLYTVSRTDYLTGGPVYVTWGGYTNGGAGIYCLGSWVQS